MDAQIPRAGEGDAARDSFEALVRYAATCATTGEPTRCVVDSLFAGDQLVTVPEPGDPASSTVTSVLVSHRGNCAALTALVLAVADRVGAPMEAVVFPRHVVVRAPGDDHVFELLDRGAVLTMAQLRKRLGADGGSYAVVKPHGFLGYYLDNLAVRLAEGGDPDRSTAMFEKAIDDGPRVARFRFNYGTFLLGRDQLEPAENQLRRAVRLDESNAAAWANLGVVVAKQGRTEKARGYFERALRHEPGNRIAAENLKALNSKSPPPR